MVSNPGDILSVNSNRIVPRLAVAWDVEGNGNHVVHVTYGQYSGRYNEAQIGANSPVGNPPDINFTYAGPAGQGRGFAPGFDLANYPLASAFVFNAPLANTFMAPDLKSPLTHEFTVSYGANLGGGRGYAEATYVLRRTHDLIEDFQTMANGVSHVLVSITDPNTGSATTDPTAPAFTNRIYQNTNLAHRQYEALVFQSRYRITQQLERQRPLHAAAAERRQLRGRRQQHARIDRVQQQPVDHRQLPGGVQRDAELPGRAGSSRSSAIACGSGPSTTGIWIDSATCRCQGSGGSTRV